MVMYGESLDETATEPRGRSGPGTQGPTGAMLRARGGGMAGGRGAGTPLSMGDMGDTVMMGSPTDLPSPRTRSSEAAKTPTPRVLTASPRPPRSDAHVGLGIGGDVATVVKEFTTLLDLEVDALLQEAAAAAEQTKINELMAEVCGPGM